MASAIAGRQDLDLFHAEGAAFARVRIERRDGKPRLRDARPPERPGEKIDRRRRRARG